MTSLASIQMNPAEQLTLNGEQAPRAIAVHGAKYFVSLLTQPEKLGDSRHDWQDLAARAADPNPFYEPWFFLPAARHLDANLNWRILLIHRETPAQRGNLQLCGFFPFVQSRGPLGLTQWSLWKNQFCFLTNPLIDKADASNVLRAVAQFAGQPEAGCGCLDFPILEADGLLHQSFTEVLRENLSTTFIPDHYLRAANTCKGDVEEYFKNAVGGHHLREYRRGRRKLEAQGQLEFRQVHDTRGVDYWVDWFLDLEAKGWKARAGTAIKLHDDESAFFREMINAGYRRDQVRLEGLFLNGEPIALKCNLISKPVAFAFKIAFDEAYSNCSPGVQLEFESLKQFAVDPELELFDSCAAPGHQMIDRLWTERRAIRQLTMSTSHCSSEVVIGSLPLFRALNRVRKRWVESLSGKFSRSVSDKSS